MNMIFQVSARAWAGLQREPAALRRAVMAPVLLWALVSVVPVSEHWLVSLSIGVIGVGAYVVLAVRVHRYLLMEPDQASADSIGLYFIFGVFLVLGLLMLVLVSLVLKPLAELGALISLPVMIGCMYAVARLSLVLPDRAMGRSSSLVSVWSWSHRNGWKLFAVLFLPLLLCQIALGLLTFWMEPLPSNIANNLLNIPITIFGVALLSQAYLELAGTAAEPVVGDVAEKDDP
ncbi:hypothetical protein [Halopseudomonas sp.]|uniref:hypothetical protein n=1 Tax=Halopseudomonas sp. TaxID=2901191 RepID=UPI0030032C92|tara:strand:- start:816 stop:1511 length:696 start_codon:yes stop_codon:yes gene_type:complete